jgi:hypothetical protein
MVTKFSKNWLTLAEEASTERNSARLRNLVAELCRALDDQHETKIRSVLTGHHKD